MGFLVSVRQAYRPASAIPDGGETGGPARAAPTGARPHPTATAPEDEGTIVCAPCKRFPVSGVRRRLDRQDSPAAHCAMIQHGPTPR